MQDYSPAILRAVVKAAVQRAAPGVTDGQAADLARRIIAADQPEITDDGDVRLASGEDMTGALARHRQSAPHLFDPAPASAKADAAAASRAKLRGMKAGDRLEAANNADAGMTGAWVREFRKGNGQ